MNYTKRADISEKRQHSILSMNMLLILAISCGMSVANLYYSQPLLADMAQTFQVSARQMGTISMLTQTGYALGLFLFVPLGDIKEKKRLILYLLGAVSLSLLGVAFASNPT
ncbi:MAG: MFS transporter, partial [Bacillota bacterium]|nr:MFS transporter [Bacillota bacterium]